MHLTNLQRIGLALLLLSYSMHAQAYTTWFNPVFYSDQQYTNGDLYGYLTNAVGISAGIDKALDTKTIVGVGLSYFNAKQKDINSTSSQVVINNYQASLYGNYDLYKAIYLDWVCNAGVNNYKNTNYFTNTAYTKGNNMGQQFSARALIHKLYTKNSIQFTPQINANMLYLHQNAYTAQGVNMSNQKVQGNNDGIFMLGVGFKMASTYTRSRWQIRPEIRCILYYDVLAANINALTALLVGGPAISTSTVPGRGSGQFGASLIGYAYRNVKCAFNYDLLLKSAYFNNVIGLHVHYYL